ncbi:hypothetical protein F2Q69_00037571 [Brassica cretica]|uniref:Uncharacterized protein n=1 Tax=Brassica cretica TaxID=69181 RepID=A0A8S9SW92_BRACR|nr:hypothetical protein F2Q69_00037571 [Brassica cretica]
MPLSRTLTLRGRDLPPSLVKAKLDSVHKLLRKQVCLVEDAEVIDTEGRVEEADLNFISGTGFQEAARRRFRSRESDEFRRIALVSIDAKPQTSVDRSHPKLIDILSWTSIETQMPLSRTLTLRGRDLPPSLVKAKLDSVHKLLRKQVCLVEDAEVIDTEGRVEEADLNFISGTGFQVVKQEKLQEGDFEVESLMSFGGSHWCRSTPSHKHRSTEVIQN